MQVKFLTAAPLKFGDLEVSFSHKVGDPDFHRVLQHQVHLLADHNPTIENQLGTVRRAWHDHEASYAEVDLYEYDDPIINKAKFLLESGEQQGLSAGIVRIGNIKRVGRRKLLIENWELGEISVVAMPKDSNTAVAPSRPAGQKAPEQQAAALLPLQSSEPFYVNLALGTLSGTQAGAELLALADQSNFTMEEDETMTKEELLALMASDPNAFANLLAQAQATAAVADAPPQAVTATVDAPDWTAVAEAVAERVLSGVNLGAQAAPESLVASAQEALEASVAPPVDPRLAAMADIAAGQEKVYDAQAVRSLQLEAVQMGMTIEDFGTKLKTLQLQPDPVAPNDSNEQAYDIGAALLSMAYGNQTMAKYEQDVSLGILSQSNLGVHGPGVLAIPRNVVEDLMQLNTQILGGGGGDAAPARYNQPGMYIRADVPDPLDILPLVTMLPSGPGDPRIIKITVPSPAGVAEPGDGGYGITGDASVAAISITPHLIVGKLAISRVTNVEAPQLLTNILTIALARLRELQNQHLLTGGAGVDIQGLYGYSGIGTSAALTTVAGVDVDVVEAAIKTSFAFPNGNRRIIIGTEMESAWKKLARPDSVDAFYVNRQVNGVPVLETNYITAGGKAVRGLVGPFADIYVKQWDNAIFVSRRYEDGNDILVVEMFWDMMVGHPEQFYRFRQD